MQKNIISSVAGQTKTSVIRDVFETAPAGAINMGLGEIMIPPPPSYYKLCEALVGHSHFAYSTNAGLYELRQLITDSYQLGDIDADNVCVTCGAQEALYASLKAIINPGDEVIIPRPSFVAYASLVQLMGGVVVSMEPDADLRICSENLHKLITRRTKAILFSNPNNPSSRVLNVAEVKLLAEISAKHDVLLICDEVYLSLHLDTPFSSLLKTFDNCIIINSFSKSHALTGWRIGWLITRDKKLMTAIVRMHQYMTTCAPTPAQKMAISLFSEVGKSINLYYQKKILANYNYTVKKLFANKISFFKSKAGFYLLVAVHGEDKLLAKMLASKGIITVPGSAFGDCTRGYLRINYALETNLLMKTLDKLISLM